MYDAAGENVIAQKYLPNCFAQGAQTLFTIILTDVSLWPPQGSVVGTVTSQHEGLQIKSGPQTPLCGVLCLLIFCLTVQSHAGQAKWPCNGVVTTCPACFPSQIIMR